MESRLEQLLFMYLLTSMSGLSTLLDNAESDKSVDDCKLLKLVAGNTVDPTQVGGKVTRVTLKRDELDVEKNVGELPVDKLPADKGDNPGHDDDV